MTEGQDTDPPDSRQVAGQSLWQTCIDQLAQELPEQQFNTWIKPLTAQASGDLSRVTIFVANRFKMDWVRAQYSHRISALLEKFSGQSIEVELALAPREAVAKSQVPQKTVENSAPEARTEAGEDHVANSLKNRLNSALTFDTLVEGTANRMARAAAMHVSGMPGHLYNPLFIYGGVGLGKTHLMHAVGNRLLADRPGAKVLYIHAEQFVSDVVKAYQRKTFDEFKERYHSLDLLLIDDVQFFAGKDSTQEEFFHTFNALVDQSKQIVISADRAPGEIKDLEDRIKSRMQCGLVVDLHPTDYELRLGILQQKVDYYRQQYRGLVLANGVLEFLAHRITTNVRVLEGALTRLFAFASLVGREITLDLAQDCLADILRASDRKLTIEEIQRKVAEHYNIRLSDMIGPKRVRNIARPRQIAMYLSKQLTLRSLPDIGRRFGGRDHTTIMHGVRKIEELMTTDSQLSDDLQLLRRLLQG